MKIKGILFDFDGVLADTMEDNFLAWKKAFKNKYNAEIKREDYFPLEGMKLINIAKSISQKYNINANLEEIVNSKNKYYLHNHSFCFYPGVEEFINLIKEKKILTGLISASPKEKLDKTVPNYFLKKFNVIITGDDCERGKPHPHPYLKAINNLNISSEESIVIENAPLGIKSARNAGIYCIAIESTLDKSFLSEADKIVNKFEDITNLKIINNLINLK